MEEILEPINENQPVTSFPELSIEQKLFIRDLQINLVSAKENAEKLVKAAESALLDGIGEVAKKLGLKEVKTFDLMSLKFNG